jgi:hypothetical protein
LLIATSRAGLSSLWLMKAVDPEKTGQDLAQLKHSEVEPLISRSLELVREEMRDNPYIKEALRVLPVHGYRSAIGSLWNAVVDDLREKVLHRSLTLFNKFMKDKVSREVKNYEDFQNCVNDDQLLEGAYKIGAIGWEAHKILKHAKETRHIFDGHPKSSEPSVFKVLSMIDDCTKYVLNVEYPPQIIDLDEYMVTLDTGNFDRNPLAIEDAVGNLPELYTKELAHRLFSAYVDPASTTVLRSNIEFVVPILWPLLPRSIKIEVARQVDKLMLKGQAEAINQGFRFISLAKSVGSLSMSARRYRLGPIVKKLKENLDHWAVENQCVSELKPYAANIPPDLVADYVWSLTHAYVGNMGSSYNFSRTDFYANGAALDIPEMFAFLDDRAAETFVRCIRKSDTLKRRIQHPAKLLRLRALGNILSEKVSSGFSERAVLKALTSSGKEKEFFKLIA